MEHKNRRNFIKKSLLASSLAATGLSSKGVNLNEPIAENIPGQESVGNLKGDQRLSIKKLNDWRNLEYGMFIHFGMNTYTGKELPSGKNPSTLYNPTNLDVDQWVQVIRDAGMKYAVLTAKHVSGHCLWTSDHTDYHVGTSGNKTDVVEAFVKACDKYNIIPGLYYCSWDNHHLLGSETPSLVGWGNANTTQEYRDFQMKQVEELLTRYGKLGEIWIDIPGFLGEKGRQEQYDQIASLQPETFIMLNSGISNGEKLKKDYSWPTDLMAIERYLPSSNRGYKPWFTIKDDLGEEKNYFIPAEVCDPIGYEWFWTNNDKLRSVEELLGMHLICKSREVNLLLNVPPDVSGRIPKSSVNRLMELSRKMNQV